MLNYAVDWATKKDLAITKDGEKVKKVPNTIEAYIKYLSKIGIEDEDVRFYFEAGGGDIFKLITHRSGCKVFTIAGKEIHDKVINLGLEKSDENDARIIWKTANEEPERFRRFDELDELTANICVIFKKREDVNILLVRAKNQLFALSKSLEFLSLGKNKEKIFEKEKEEIKIKTGKVGLYTKILDSLVKQHPIWNYLSDIKGTGPVCIGGLIAEIKTASRFSNKYELRKYAGMVTKKGNQKFTHKLKRALFYFIEGIIKARTPFWREMYDSRKIDYAEKHPDWSKSKINNYAMKFVETKFLDELYKKMVKIENAIGIV